MIRRLSNRGSQVLTIEEQRVFPPCERRSSWFPDAQSSTAQRYIILQLEREKQKYLGNVETSPVWKDFIHASESGSLVVSPSHIQHIQQAFAFFNCYTSRSPLRSTRFPSSSPRETYLEMSRPTCRLRKHALPLSRARDSAV